MPRSTLGVGEAQGGVCPSKHFERGCPILSPLLGKGGNTNLSGRGAPHKPPSHVWLLSLFTPLPAFPQQLPTPAAITDPTKLESKTVENMQTFSIEKLYTTRAIGGTTWSPDGKQIAFVSNISGRNNIWLVPATGGWPTQLTISDQRQTQPAWSPDGTWIAYASDYDGNEQWDIFLVSPKTGDVVNLTTTKEISEESPVWSPDGKQIAYTAKPKTGSSYEIDLMDVYTRHVKHLTQNTAKGPQQLSSHLLARRQVRSSIRRPTPPAKTPTSSCSTWPAARPPISRHTKASRPTPPTISRPTARPSSSPRTPTTGTTMWDCSTSPRRRSIG